MTLQLKHEKGWFAAGVEVEKALKILSDGGFKLFLQLCLMAPRHSGVVETSQTELARTLQKGKGTIRKYLRELEQQGICRLSGFAAVPYCRGRIEITAAYWPYHRRENASENRALDQSVDQVRRLLEARHCVRAAFSTADEILARRWLENGIPMDRIERAILLGCARKYVAWRNHHDRGGTVTGLPPQNPGAANLVEDRLSSARRNQKEMMLIRPQIHFSLASCCPLQAR